MKHKKQLRKAQDVRKNPSELDRSDNCESESENNDKNSDQMKSGMDPDLYMENEDDVDIEDDICSPEHLL